MRNEKKWYFFFVIDFRAFKHHLDLVTKPLSDRKTTSTECCTGVMLRACHSLPLWRISTLKRTKRKKNAGLKFKGAWVYTVGHVTRSCKGPTPPLTPVVQLLLWTFHPASPQEWKWLPRRLCGPLVFHYTLAVAAAAFSSHVTVPHEVVWSCWCCLLWQLRQELHSGSWHY